MGWLKSLGNLLSGDGLIAKGLDFVNDRWPPDMSEEQRRRMEVVVKDMLHQQQVELLNAARKDEQLFNERTIALEGTARDLQSIPFIGSIVIFARGMFRPAFSYMTAYIDWIYFSTDTTGWSEQQQTLLLAMNLLVLVFFFGERAMKNIMPLITNAFAVKRATREL